MTADDAHAKLARALEHASSPLDPDLPEEDIEQREQILSRIVQPIALASIALELREIRLQTQPGPLARLFSATEPAKDEPHEP
jgi:hypothetical protein